VRRRPRARRARFAPLYRGAGAGARRACPGRGSAAAASGSRGLCCPVGLRRAPDGPRWAWRGSAAGPGRSGLGQATGSAQSARIGFSFFSNLFFNAKTNSRKV
jgi:hypothetical protein